MLVSFYKNYYILILFISFNENYILIYFSSFWFKIALKEGYNVTRYRNSNGQEDLKQKLNWFGAMAVPIAFVNGLFFGGYALRKIRQYWEGGPMD